LTIPLAALIVVGLVNLVLLAVLVWRSRVGPIERAVREELRQGRDEVTRSGRDLREELGQGLKSSADTLVKAVGELGALQRGQLDAFGTQLATMRESTERRLDGARSMVESQLTELRQANDTQFNIVRTTLESSLHAIADGITKASQGLRDEVTNRLGTSQESAEKRYDILRQTVDGKLQNVQDHTVRSSRELRDELAATLKGSADSLGEQLTRLGGAIQMSLDAVKGTVEGQLTTIEETNLKRLDEIRKTVDEQLQTTLERRLTESFKVVSSHLESVQRGLGEMQALATGVGDLKRVLTNVKARGTWAEFQLGAILDEILTPDQYAKNVQTRDDSSERVEFAVRLPGRSDDVQACVWLPIDSKFPQEPYVRLMNAAEKADAELIQEAVADLVRTMRMRAQEIHDKYIAPPHTTDFGILFVPTEGLHAEVLRVPNLAAELQHRFRVMVAGPTNLAALLSSLRMGFQTLAIERRAGEVWQVLRAVKTEFGRFGAVLVKLRRQLDRASRTIDATGVRTRAMERQLRDVEALPPGLASDILKLSDVVETVPIEDEIEPETG
jgi:DNA recombination protein RmuC